MDNSENPSTPQPQHDIVEPLSTSDLRNWINSIDLCLNEICQVAAEGKLNTEQKLKISTLARKVGNGVAQMSVEYQSLKQKAIAVHTSLQALKERQDLADYLADFKRSITDTIETGVKPVTEKVSFADMVKTDKNNFVRPKNLSSITIYPRDALRSSDETKSIVQKVICPEEMKLHVRSMRKTRNGGVIISTETKEDIEKLKQSTNLVNQACK